jgi:hypothetical protein
MQARRREAEASGFASVSRRLLQAPHDLQEALPRQERHEPRQHELAHGAGKQRPVRRSGASCASPGSLSIQVCNLRWMRGLKWHAPRSRGAARQARATERSPKSGHGRAQRHAHRARRRDSHHPTRSTAWTPATRARPRTRVRRAASRRETPAEPMTRDEDLDARSGGRDRRLDHEDRGDEAGHARRAGAGGAGVAARPGSGGGGRAELTRSGSASCAPSRSPGRRAFA